MSESAKAAITATAHETTADMDRRPFPEHLLDLVRDHAPWCEGLGPDWISFPVARLRYIAAIKSWTSYWRDYNLLLFLDDQLPPSQ